MLSHPGVIGESLGTRLHFRFKTYGNMKCSVIAILRAFLFTENMLKTWLLERGKQFTVHFTFSLINVVQFLF